MGHGAPRASVGIAGVNTHPLHAAALGLAGNSGSTLRPHLQHITARSPLALSSRLGDQAARVCWSHACCLLDYTYVTCPDRVTQSVRHRSGFARLWALENRTLPVYLDSAA
jgi:hypothetical protein